MDEKLIGVIVLMMCCISSSVSFAMSMGGGDDSGADTGAGGGASSETKKYRYVRIAKTEDVANWHDRYINLHEVYVYDANGTNLALNKTVTAHENHNVDYAPGLPNLVDGNDGTGAHTGANIHDESQPQRQYFQIDLGAEKEIKSVKIVDRPGYPLRLDKVKVILMKTETPSSTDDVTSSTLTTADAKAGLIHTYDFGTNKWTHGN
jgi:hypothetical protein